MSSGWRSFPELAVKEENEDRDTRLGEEYAIEQRRQPYAVDGSLPSSCSLLTQQLQRQPYTVNELSSLPSLTQQLQRQPYAVDELSSLTLLSQQQRQPYAVDQRSLLTLLSQQQSQPYTVDKLSSLPSLTQQHRQLYTVDQRSLLTSIIKPRQPYDQISSLLLITPEQQQPPRSSVDNTQGTKLWQPQPCSIDQMSNLSPSIMHSQQRLRDIEQLSYVPSVFMSSFPSQVNLTQQPYYIQNLSSLPPRNNLRQTYSDEQLYLLPLINNSRPQPYSVDHLSSLPLISSERQQPEPLSLLPLIDNSRPQPYSDIDQLSLLPSLSSRQQPESVERLSSLPSMVNQRELFSRNSLALDYGDNYDITRPEVHSKTIIPFGATRQDSLLQELSTQNRLLLPERNHSPLLSTPSLSSLTNMYEQDPTRRDEPTITPFPSEINNASLDDLDRYSSSRRWSPDLRKRSFPIQKRESRAFLTETKSSDVEYRNSGSRKRSRSPLHRSRSSRKERSFSPRRTGRHYDSESTTSSRRKRDRSPVHGSGGSSEHRRECKKKEKAYRERSTESREAVKRLHLDKDERTSHRSPSNKPQLTKAATTRVSRWYCLPGVNLKRTIGHQKSDKYYKSPSSTSLKSTCIATENIAKLHNEFEEMISKIPSENASDISDLVDVPDSVEEDQQYVSNLLGKPNTDSDSGDESGSDLDGYITIDESDCDSSDDSQLSPPKSCIKNQVHPRKLNPELWFNVEGELNHGRICLCSLQDKKKWIVHNIYPNEKMPEACEAMGNNGIQLYHYWVTVSPQTNFMTEYPSRIESHGRTYTFEGFSLLSHSPLDAVPRCLITRFNLKYELFFIQEPIPDNFCIKDLDLFSRFLFHEILEMFDWDIGNKGNEEHCSLFHFLPRFTRKIGVSADGSEKYELLSMRKVFEHILSNRKPLIEDQQLSDKEALEKCVASSVNSIVTKPGWKPSSLRVDDIERLEQNGKDVPIIVHHGIRPVQLSFSGDPKCQMLLKSYLKLRNSIMNRPDASQRERLKLLQMRLTLDNMKMKDSLRRDCVVRLNAAGMLKTGLNSDVTQHAMLLPVLVHHVRYHLSLQTFDSKIGYEFKDRTLCQLALTHPSYCMNYGTNPDHARNTLSNCGVKQPRYGDKRTRFRHIKKKGIVHLIEIMAKLQDLEGSQSFIQHNERLEFLGDAILEFICTSHLFFLFPEMAEGGLVTHRSSLVQNRHLACVAKKLGLDAFMQFSHGPDLCHEEDMDHAMANCLEAILGAIYLDSDVNTVRKVFCQLAFDESELRELWSDLSPHPLQTQQPKGDRSFIPSSEVLKRLVKLEESVGVQFTHIRLLARAFTHPQVGFNNLTLGNNQRMEFLGDSVVQWVVTEYLYHHFPDHHEGHLTLLRSSLVNRNIQAQVAGEIGLNQYVNFGVGQCAPKLRQKHMADLFEAFLAALFVDKGLDPVKVFCKVCLFPRLRDVIINQEWLDPKSQLQSCCLTEARQSDSVPVYKILKNIGSPNMKLYTVGVYFNGRRLASGDGDNVREAEMNAAQKALATNYFPEYARQKRVLYQKHKK